MSNAVVGALRVVLGLDSAAFTEGLSDARRALATAGQQMQDIGRNLSLYVTAPLAALGTVSLRTAGSFEASLNRLSAAANATEAEMAAMREMAMSLGADTSKSANEAADAMEMLARNGLTASQILDGAAEASILLSEATGGDLSRAADVATNAMAQFRLRAEDMREVVNDITGVTLQSQFDFEDYALALGQAGGVAGGLGVDFREFNAAIAATSSVFTSGSDAGTSFKNFLVRLTPASTQAAAAMEELGLRFFDADGSMRSISEIAGELQTRMGGLSDEAKTVAMTDIFGTDGMRTAIALMEQGAEGVENFQERIAATDAGEQAAARMQGLNGELEKLAGAFETLQIAIAESGLLRWATDAASALAGFVEWLSQTNPQVLKMGVVVAGLAAAIGPALVVLGLMATAVAAIGWPVTLVVIGIGALTAAIIAFWPEISQLAAVIGDFLSGAWASFEAAWDGMVETVHGVARAIGEFVLAMPGFFAALPGQMLQIGTDIITGLWDGYRMMWVQVGMWLLTLGDQMVSYLAEIPGRMLQVGVDIIQGLWNGLQQKWAETSAWFGGIGDQITGFITNPLGIQSPSTVMHQLGVWTMQGYDEGLQSYAGTIGDTVSNIASTIGQAFKGVVDGSKTVGQAIAHLAIQIGQMFLSQGFQALAGMGGGWGFVGQLLSGLLGFSRGGTIMPGGSGGIDSQLVMFRKSPNERVDITKPGQMLGAGGGGPIDIRLVMEEGAMFEPRVAGIAGREANVSVERFAASDKMASKVRAITSKPRIGGRG